VGGKPKIVAKHNPSVSNSAWESTFQMNVDCHFTNLKLSFLNISEIPTNLRPNTFLYRKSPPCSGILFAGTKVVDRPRSNFRLYVDTWHVQRIRMEKQSASARCLLSAALLECWPQVCRVKIRFTLLPTNRFVSTKTSLIKCLVNWIPLRICFCSRNTQPHRNKLN